ncbi:penicillin-binding protein PBP2B [Streptococcus macacae]|uniref:Penicillin-binding protein, transpeptidase domain protein n=1 Tax=Streptococcus macacae NCTC 11558 TaxID=764298 RepID=G5JVV5_9STRE|nr:penicillin-binding protein PBP2B [Streptococcus macacae]EHJ51557.1 penicillin-binding protein, transpeptidase domain protein [Streptococcus macacae NCTC 11558]SUN78945.1 penicillin-binding protein 2B [Streptococcus macacae NCTC 11558]
MFRKKKSSKKKQSEKFILISNRINLLFFLIVTLFTILLLRLVQMQIYDEKFYKKKLTESTTYTIKTSSPRGQIYDSQGVPLVENEVKEVVAFTRSNHMDAKDIKENAKKLANIVTLTESKVTKRQKKDYYLADPKNYQKVVKKLPHRKKYDQFGNNLKESDIYANAVKAVPDSVIDYSEDEKKIIYIFSQMNATSVFNTASLTTGDLTSEQIAVLATSKSNLKGISVKTDWERKSVKNSITSVIGKVSSQKTGLPAEEAKNYVKKGYSLNDRVGTSYLEKEYENDLQGSRTIQSIKVNKEGKIISDKITAKGTKGKNLKLTLDLKFQKGVEDILNRYFKSELGKGNTKYSEGVYAVALNPNTGAILSMAGLDHDLKTGDTSSNALGTVTEVFTPGSVVKGATLTAGWANNVLFGNQILNDQPIQFAGSNPINSWFTNGSLPITASQSLEYSSNTYMVQLALKLMGQDYHSGMALSTEGYKDAMKKLRATYAQYGLGVSTGIDLPGESKGYVSEKYDPANVLTESFGQFDNYTTMQLAQYVAAVANGGKRVAPHIVEGIYDNDKTGGLGNRVKTIDTKVLNNVSISNENLSIIKDGFYNVVNGKGAYSTGKTLANGASVPISAKTGTAETYVKGSDGKSIDASNLNVVAYAPSNNPQIAVAVVLPHETDLHGTTSHAITRDIINLYQQMHPMNANE